MWYLHRFAGSLGGVLLLWVSYVLNLWLDFIPKYEPYVPSDYSYSSSYNAKGASYSPYESTWEEGGPAEANDWSSQSVEEPTLDFDSSTAGGGGAADPDMAPDAPRVDLTRIREHLASLSSELQTNLDGTIVGVTIRGLVFNGDLEIVGQLSTLETLDLQNATYIDDDGLRHLAQLPRLRSLTLRNAGITDSGMSQLFPLRALQLLDVRGSDVTSFGASLLQQVLPQCDVKFGES